MLIPRNPATVGAKPAPVAQPAPKPVPVMASVVPPSPIPAAPPVQIPQAVIPVAPVAPTNALSQRTSRPALPAFVESAKEGEIPAGLEHVGNEAHRMAMLSIAQSQSPQVQEHRLMNAGDCYLTTDRDVAFFPVNTKVPVIAAHYYKSWDQWNHRDLGGGLVSSSIEPGGPNAKQAQAQLSWRRANKGRQPTAQEEPVRAIESLNFVGLFKDQQDDGSIRYVAAVIPFAKSKYKKGATWINLVTKASEGKYPIYAFEYTIQTIFEKSKVPGQAGWYNFDVDFSPEPLSAEDYAQAKKAHEEFDAIFKSRQLQVEADKTDGTPDIEVEIQPGGAAPKGSEAF